MNIFQCCIDCTDRPIKCRCDKYYKAKELQAQINLERNKGGDADIFLKIRTHRVMANRTLGGVYR